MFALGLLYLAMPLFAAAAHKPTKKILSGKNRDYDQAVLFLHKSDKLSLIHENIGAKASWRYDSNLTEENKKAMIQSQIKEAQFTKTLWKKVNSFAWKEFKVKNETVYRWFQKISTLGPAALSERKQKVFNQLTADMQDVYARAKVCEKGTTKNCTLALEPDLTERLKNSKDYNELKRIWTDWRKVTGKKVKKQFTKYVELSNEVAKLNGFKDNGDMWRHEYETDTFEKDLKKLWRAVEPFYKQLHAFVRRKLIQHYPKNGILPNGPIPAHILGDMWAQGWGSIFNIVKPFPKKKFVDATKTMVKKKMTPLDMFKLSEEFYVSLGLYPMTQEFWNLSIIEKPKDREIICHASAWDFYDGKDFRIKQCTRVNMQDLRTVHHEMGHIQYYQQYAHQPGVFRSGANPGFHEAIGDVLALSVTTRKHLKKIKLIPGDLEEDEEMNINTLMKTALDKVAFLPFAYLLDSHRWKIFSGKVKPCHYNSLYWKLRLKYQGICPPVKRTEKDLDAASKYHVIAGEAYMRYFVSHILQFQFHKALCKVACHEGPLHLCDIYKNKDAGKLLSDTLKLGSSVHWSEAMNVITQGQTKKMDVQPLLEYFKPLIKWLKKQNKKETIGWKSKDPMMCP